MKKKTKIAIKISENKNSNHFYLYSLNMSIRNDIQQDPIQINLNLKDMILLNKETDDPQINICIFDIVSTLD